MSAAAIPLARPDARVQTGIGWAPVINAWLAHLPRLASGDAQVLSILYINAELHPPRPKGDPSPRPKFSRPITTEELAAYCRCTVRAIQTALEDLDRRKVINRRKTGAGFMYALPFGTWAELPDRPPAPPKLVPIAEPKPAEEDTDDSTPAPIEEHEYNGEPQELKPGKKSRAADMGGCNPGKFSVRNQSGAEVSYCLSVYNGIANFVLLKATIPEANNKRSQTQSIAPHNPQTIETTSPRRNPSSAQDKEKFKALHELLDDYCLNHHGTTPNDSLLQKIVQALGKASVAQFKRVCQAKIRSGKVIPMGLFINLAEDAARGIGKPGA